MPRSTAIGRRRRLVAGGEFAPGQLMITRNVSGHTLLTGEYVAGQPPAIARDQLDPTRVDPGASARSQGDDRAAGGQVKCGNPPRFTMSVSRSGCTTTSSSAAKRASTAIGGAVA